MTRPGLPKLIATDLDGTLVRSDDTVSGYTHEVLERVRAAGIRVVGATGRGPRLTQLTRNDIRDADFLVLAQGGWVIDQVENQVLRSAALSGAAVAALLADLEAEMGPLSVMVEALAHEDAPLWGDYDPPGRPQLRRDLPAGRGQRHRSRGRRRGRRRRPRGRAGLRRHAQ
jgi:HAD superfamily hydrolase (TIGR01484 family)